MIPDTALCPALYCPTCTALHCALHCTAHPGLHCPPCAAPCTALSTLHCTDHPEQEAEHEVPTPGILMASYLAAPLLPSYIYIHPSCLSQYNKDI